MSEFHVQVVQLNDIEKHPNADTLSIAFVHGKGGYPVIFKTGDFKLGDKAVYIPVDAVVPDEPQYDFLKGHLRIRAMRLRGIFSMGLLQPALPSWSVGQEVESEMKVVKYERPKKNAFVPRSGRTFMHSYEETSPPAGLTRFTDLEGLRRFPNVLQAGDEVVLTEKIHGCNARYLYTQGRLWVGSHNRIPSRPRAYVPSRLMRALGVFWAVWAFVFRTKPGDRFYDRVNAARFNARVRQPPFNTWWNIADQYKLEEKLSKFPDLVVFGEIYGTTQDLKYDAAPGEDKFIVFDIREANTGKWLDHDAMKVTAFEMGLPTVPELYRGPWEPEKLRSYCEGNSTLNNKHVREGFVVRADPERTDPFFGRVALKMVGQGYLLRKEGEAERPPMGNEEVA